MATVKFFVWDRDKSLYAVVAVASGNKWNVSDLKRGHVFFRCREPVEINPRF